MTPRKLTDWRQKGLLPALESESLGSAGRTYYWTDQSVFDQAVAIDALLSRYGRADAAIVGLWLSGYEIDSQIAKTNWLSYLAKTLYRRHQAASAYVNGFLGLGLSWWRAQAKRYSPTPMMWMSDLLSEVLETYYLGHSLDDLEDLVADFERQISEEADLIPSKESYEFARISKQVIGYLQISATGASNFVESLTTIEMNAVQPSLKSIHSIVEQQFLGGGIIAKRVAPALMLDLLGPAFVRVFTLTNRDALRFPLAESVAVIHGTLGEVQLGAHIDEAGPTPKDLAVIGKLREELASLWEKLDDSSGQ